MFNPPTNTTSNPHAPPQPPLRPMPTAPPTPTADKGGHATESKPTGVIQQWRRENLMKKVSLATRGVALLFSLLSFIIMASNNQGSPQNFNDYEAFRYVLAVTILSTVYTAMQVIRQGYELNTGKELFPLAPITLLSIDFSGDQIVAYLLLSAASSAVPTTNAMRQYVSNLFTDSLAASVSMAFLAFFSLVPSAVISGYKLSNKAYG